MVVAVDLEGVVVETNGGTRIFRKKPLPLPNFLQKGGQGFIALTFCRLEMA